MSGIVEVFVKDTTTNTSSKLGGPLGEIPVTTGGIQKSAITPTIKTNGGGTTSTGSSVVINSGAAAGSQHLQAAADVEADVLQELVHFEFDAGDAVIRVHIGLSVLPAASEVQDLKFVVNGDIVADATALFNESGISWVLRNEVVEVGQGSAVITSVGCIATSSGVASSVATGARIYCMGYKEAA